MKANEAPEKIYRRLEGTYIKYYDYKPAKIRYNEKEPTEYIRTDTFIEKACEWLENHNDYQRVLDNGRGVRFDMTPIYLRILANL